MDVFLNRDAQEHFKSKFQPLINELFELQSFYNENEKLTLAEGINSQQKLIHFLFNTVWDDFMEMFLLHANGYPFGALKILRALFESSVHLIHFNKNNDAIDRFWDFVWIDEKKVADFFPDAFTEDDVKEIEIQAAKAKPDYQIPICEKCKYEECEPCKKTRTSHSWMMKVNIIQLAEQVDILPEIIYSAYYLPLQETHPKLQSIIRRESRDEHGAVGYKHAMTFEQTKLMFMAAHYLVLRSCHAYLEFFKIENVDSMMEPFMERCDKIWTEITEVSTS